jgi:hypothetical protein
MTRLPLDSSRCPGDNCPSKSTCLRHTDKPQKGEIVSYAALYLRREDGEEACSMFIATQYAD